MIKYGRKYARTIVAMLMMVGITQISLAEIGVSSVNIRAATGYGRIDEVAMTFSTAAIGSAVTTSSTFALNGVQKASIHVVATESLGSATNQNQPKFPGNMFLQFAGAATRSATSGICIPLYNIDHYGLTRNLDVSGLGAACIKYVSGSGHTPAIAGDLKVYVRLEDATQKGQTP